MNHKLSLLHPYPFEKMAKLLADVTPNPAYTPIKLSIGEPQHTVPAFVQQVMADSLSYMGKYPTTKGMPELRDAIATWLKVRFKLNSISADDQLIPVSGTREAIFSFTQAAINTHNIQQSKSPSTKPLVVMPNPFYQIYEGATLLAGAEPYYVSCTSENNYVGDYLNVPDDVWKRTQLVFICSPNNPTGAVMPRETIKKLLALSDKYGFILASDECYSELYFDDAPVGLLQVCAEQGRHDYKNCIVFHSLSKRSNLPGLRSGFIAGDAGLLMPYLKYRTYQGAALPIQTQLASIAAWQDEDHVEANRVQYRAKFDLWMRELGDKLPLTKPDAGFYFWLAVPPELAKDDLELTKLFLEKLNITILAGQYLSRDTDDGNSVQKNAGKSYVRLALVADMAQTAEAVERIKTLI